MRVFSGLKNIKAVLKQQVILRNFLIFMLLFGTWLGLVIAGLTSSHRQRYSDKDLATEQTFSNGTGTIDLRSQIYSKKNRMLLLNFETKGQGSAAINPDNLSWKIYSKKANVHAVMEVIPIVDNKITVVVRDVPEDFDAFAILVSNSGVNANNISIDVPSDSSSSSEKIKKSDSDDDKENWVQFLVTTKGKYLKYKQLGDLTRNELVTSEIKKEIQYQLTQKTKLKKAIKNINKVISDNKAQIRSLQREEEYLTDDQKEDNLSKIDQLNSEIEGYEKDIERANDTTKKIDDRITMLKKKETAVKSGKFKFSNPIQVTHSN
ncbi:hypothetical protein AB9M75_11815 [Lactobacillus sp. AN1001]